MRGVFACFVGLVLILKGMAVDPMYAWPKAHVDQGSIDFTVSEEGKDGKQLTYWAFPIVPGSGGKMHMADRYDEEGNRILTIRCLAGDGRAVWRLRLDSDMDGNKLHFEEGDVFALSMEFMADHGAVPLLEVLYPMDVEVQLPDIRHYSSLTHDSEGRYRRKTFKLVQNEWATFETSFEVVAGSGDFIINLVPTYPTISQLEEDIPDVPFAGTEELSIRKFEVWRNPE